MDPCPHGQLCDEDVTALCEENRRFCRDHLDFWVCLHDLLYAREWELVQLEIVLIGLEFRDLVLPVCVQNLLWLAVETYRSRQYATSSIDNATTDLLQH